jgi:hypothetical protein
MDSNRMTNRFTGLLLALATAAFMADGAAAQVGHLDPVEKIQYDDAGDRVRATWGGVYVGPYSGSLLPFGADPSSASLTLFCIDYQNTVSGGDMWEANVTSLGDGTDLSNTRLGMAGAFSDNLVRYRSAAYLASLFESRRGDRSAISGIHAAIWSIMTPGFGSPGSDEAAAAAPWLAMASDAASGGFSGMRFSRWKVLTDVASDGFEGGRQEFLVVTTPEPGTIALLLVGLLGIGVVALRRRQEALPG